jgi:hypothetical protein
VPKGDGPSYAYSTVAIAGLAYASGGSEYYPKERSLTDSDLTITIHKADSVLVCQYSHVL